MAVPVWAVGQVLSASDVNSWFVPIVATKPADTGRNNNTVSNDPDLQLSLAANALYDVRVVIRYKGGVNGSSDGQMTLNAPSGATGFYHYLRYNIAGLSTSPVLGYDDSQFGGIHNFGTNTTANNYPLLLFASVNTSSAGTLAFAWGQNTTNGTNTTVMANSYLIAQRIG